MFSKNFVGLAMVVPWNQDMQSQRPPLTETAYLAAISASQAVRNWQVATQLFWKAQQQGVAGAWANLMILGMDWWMDDTGDGWMILGIIPLGMIEWSILDTWDGCETWVNFQKMSGITLVSSRACGNTEIVPFDKWPPVGILGWSFLKFFGW